MRIADQLRTVRGTFSGNRARSALTLLGIVIGAGSIVLLAGLLRGGEEALLHSSQRANEADLIQVRRDEPPAKDMQKTRRELSRLDGDALEGSPLLGGATVATEANRESRAFFSSRKKRARIVGAGPGAVPLYHLDLDRGRFLDADDLHERRRVCVIGQELWTDLLESRSDAIGLQIRMEDQLWTVVGVLKNKPLLGDAGDGTWMWNRKVLVPHTTFDAIFAPTHQAGRLFVRLSGGGNQGEKQFGKQVKIMERIVSSTLLRLHLGVHNFKVEGEEGEANQERLILMIIKLLLLGTGMLSLLVGGINIMNIMLVTVTERTREIGIRRAVGASPWEILFQFLLEASTIALAGGIAGVLGGILASWLATVALTRWVGPWEMHIEPWSVVLGLALSLSTGIVFGIFPAWRASRLDPVEALRYE